MKKNDEQEMDKKSAKSKLKNYLGSLPVNTRPIAIAREKKVKSGQSSK